MSGAPIGINPVAVVAKHNAATAPHGFSAAGMALGKAENLAAQKAILGGLQGTLDCSTNPDFPAASAGDMYCVKKDGKIGGSSGVAVVKGSIVLCHTTSDAGDAATVGKNWAVIAGQMGGSEGSTTLGIEWTARSAPNLNIKDVCFGADLFVAVTSDGKALVSDDYGLTWTEYTTPDASWKHIAYGGGKFVAIGDYFDTGLQKTVARVATSTDGETWTLQTSALEDGLHGLCYGDGLFVATSYVWNGGQCLMSSPDGETWTARTLPSEAEDGIWKHLAYGNGIYCAVSEYGSMVITSTDAATWTFADDNSGGEYYDLIFAGGLFVAASYEGDGTTQIRVSDDASTWTRHGVESDGGWIALGYGDGVYVAFASTTDIVATSPDAETWTAHTGKLTQNNWNAIAFGGGTLVAVSNPSSGDPILTSE